MSKSIGLSDYIRIYAALASGVLIEVRNLSYLFPKLNMQQYGYIPPYFKRSSFLASLSRLISKKEISRELDGRGNVYLKLHPKGKNYLLKKYPITFMRKSKWNGFFMVVVFDIKECERCGRNKLRHKLKELGFGMLQRSVWISPYHFIDEIKEYVRNINVANQVIVLKTRDLWLGDIKKFANKAWKLDKIVEDYQRIIAISNELGNVDGIIRERGKRDLINMYFDVLSKDPLLPIEFLPADWPQNEARKCIDKL